MSSSSASPCEENESGPPSQLAVKFKMVEEFKPQMVPASASCCKMSEDSQDSHLGHESSQSRWQATRHEFNSCNILHNSLTVTCNAGVGSCTISTILLYCTGCLFLFFLTGPTSHPKKFWQNPY